MSLTCDELRALVAAQPLGVLEAAEEERVEAHLNECTECPELQADMEQTLSLTVPVVVPGGAAAEVSWLAIEEKLQADTVREAQAAQVAVRVSLSCSYCHSELTRAEAAFCASCLAPHHVECFATHGSCSALGCPETEVVRPGKARVPRRRRGLRVFLTGLGVVSSAAAALTVAAVSFSVSSQQEQPRPTDTPDAPLVAEVPQEEEPPPQYDASLPARTQYELGFKRLARGQTDEAITYFSWALELEPRLVEAYVHRGKAYTDKGKLLLAIADFTRAIELDPRRVSAYRGRAEAHILRGNKARGIRDLEAAIKIHSGDVKSLVRLGTLRMQEANGDRSKLEVAFNDFLRASERNPRSVEAWTGRGLVRQRLGDTEAAMRDLSRAIELDPLAVDALLARAVIRMKAGDPWKAINDLDGVLKRDPDNAEILLMRARARLETGNRQYALMDLDAALSIEPRLRAEVDVEEYIQTVPLEHALAHRPNSVLLHYLRGRAHHRQGELREALRSYRKAIELEPTDVQARLQAVRILYALGDLVQARAEVDRLVELDPRSAEVYAIRGQIRAAEDPDGAFADYDQAIAINPKDARYPARSADLLMQSGRIEEAIASYTRAIELDPQLVTAFTQRGSAYERQGRLRQAMADYEYAVRLHPKHAASWLRLGLLQEKSGDEQRAVASLQQFTLLAPAHARRAEALDALVRLGVKVQPEEKPEAPTAPDVATPVKKKKKKKEEEDVPPAVVEAPLDEAPGGVDRESPLAMAVAEMIGVDHSLTNSGWLTASYTNQPAMQDDFETVGFDRFLVTQLQDPGGVVHKGLVCVVGNKRMGWMRHAIPFDGEFSVQVELWLAAATPKSVVAFTFGKKYGVQFGQQIVKINKRGQIRAKKKVDRSVFANGRRVTVRIYYRKGVLTVFCAGRKAVTKTIKRGDLKGPFGILLHDVRAQILSINLQGQVDSNRF